MLQYAISDGPGTLIEYGKAAHPDVAAYRLAMIQKGRPYAEMVVGRVKN